jgi:hypothetical protein
LGLDGDLSLTVSIGNLAARLLIVVAFVSSSDSAAIVVDNDLGCSFTQVQALLGVVIEALPFVSLHCRIHTRPSALVVRIGPPVTAIRREVSAFHSIGALLELPDIVAIRPIISPEFLSCLDSSVGPISTRRLDFDEHLLIILRE